MTLTFEQFKESVITDGNRYGGKAKENNGVLKFMYNSFLTTGVAYCPCRPEQTPDTICACKEYREGGKCCCGLFIRG